MKFPKENLMRTLSVQCTFDDNWEELNNTMIQMHPYDSFFLKNDSANLEDNHETGNNYWGCQQMITSNDR